MLRELTNSQWPQRNSLHDYCDRKHTSNGVCFFAPRVCCSTKIGTVAVNAGLMTKIVLLTLVLVNTLGLLLCDDTNTNTANPAMANATANAMIVNGNVMLDMNGNPMVNTNMAVGANANFGLSNSTQANTAYPPTGANMSTTTGNSAGTGQSTGGNTAGTDTGNIAPVSTPRQ